MNKDTVLLIELFQLNSKIKNLFIINTLKCIKKNAFLQSNQGTHFAMKIKKAVMSNSKYQICTRCVMDTSDPEITFDDQGRCNHCTTYLTDTTNKISTCNDNGKSLNKLIDIIKSDGINNPYDCLIGVSGGLDSCYLAYISVKLGLRPLAVHMDNGWNAEESVKNIKYIVNKLNIDYQTEVLNWEEFKDLQLAFLKASVPEIETPTDVATLAVLHKMASRYKIKYILSGGNYVTEGILPKLWHYDAKDAKYLKAIHRKFGSIRIKKYPTFDFKKEFYYKYAKGIKMIYPLNYLSYSKQEAKETLEKELGWKYYGGKHYESFFTRFIQSYVLFKKFGIDYRRATYSTMICTGEMSREKALSEILSEKPYKEEKIQEDVTYFCKKFEISIDEFSNIMNNRPLYYFHYPNNKKVLEFIYKTYRFINKR